MSQPPPDTPNFNGLGHEQSRAFKVWFFLRRNHGRWFTANEISARLDLAQSTVESALSRIFGLPPAFRPRLRRRIIEDEGGRKKEYKFVRIRNIIFEE